MRFRASKMRRTSWRAEKLLASERSYALFKEYVLEQDFYKWMLMISFSWCSILRMSLYSYDSKCESLNGLHKDEGRRVTVCCDRSVSQNGEFLIASANINHWSNSVPRGLRLWARIRTRVKECCEAMNGLRHGLRTICDWIEEWAGGYCWSRLSRACVFSPIPYTFSSVRMKAMKEGGGW